MSQYKTPTKEAQEEAIKYPNGYVYVIDEAYTDKEEVPPEYIVGCWKVDSQGVIAEPFIPNPNYHIKLS
ncbi:hypothetical protein C900_01517 [Fulvivirga imtechensis AK7]|uniref:Uncharacterized protein n=1 Tax=Fulvivirga imtechensis AK7 TaxID=1237149 RepID=L8JXS6_9BACT|nr:hypothetical protein [Fulvivirga imtechensis]ELR72434.1 hypothetical protein C900_01517 [Fulvivirga imtechensis AK7]